MKRLSQVAAVVGTQWGDEGKGKITDYLAADYDIIARAAGGANAGHTIFIKGEKYVFHLLPSGCLNKNTKIILGSGMVIHLPTLLGEINLLKKKGINILPRLYIAQNAHLVLEMHKQMDEAHEQKRAKKGGAIGTTKRGIGPTYMDKMRRNGLRGEALTWSEDKRLAAIKLQADDKKHYSFKIDMKLEIKQLNKAAKLLGKRVIDTVEYLHTAHSKGKRILVEGAQAMFLDIDHGSYPYVTASATTTAGALQGLGLSPRQLDDVIGVVKAYCTRVGNGDFPTEASGDAEKRLRDIGGEFGSTTGRPRRCGWLSLPDLKRAVHVNGLSGLCLTKLDVLDQEIQIPVATAISRSGQPTYSNLPGWQTSTKGVKEFIDLPKEAQDYIRFIEHFVETPVQFVGTGPDRHDLVVI